MDVSTLLTHPNPAESIGSLSDEDLQRISIGLLSEIERDRIENQLLYYEPVSEKAREIHLSTAHNISAFGGKGSCVPLTEKVLMADGTWKPLGEVRVGDRVMAADPETQKAEPANVTAVHRNGIKEAHRITFNCGGSFVATAEHQVPMLLGAGKKTSKGYPKKARKRRLGDYLEAIPHRYENCNAAKRIACISPKEMQFEGDDGVEKLIPPYLLGALIGDGVIGSKPARFCNVNPEVIEKVSIDLNSIGMELKRYKGPTFGIRSKDFQGRCGDSIYKRLEKIGLWGSTAHTKSIPRFCFCKDREYRKELLAGLVDTDGGDAQFCTVSGALANDFVMLVRSLGGKATLTKRISKISGDDAEYQYHAIYWRMEEPLPLAMKYKQRPASRRPLDWTRRTCKSVESVGYVPVGDITVDHPAHCWITGDYVIVSNSKTDTMLVELIIKATGIVPICLQDDYPKKKLKPGGRYRVIVESQKATLHPVIIPKLKYWNWDGDSPESGLGHWGWIPKSMLVDGSWDKSWSEKLSMLTLSNGSTIQFMSYDNNPEDFASGSFHAILHDEPPRHSIYRESVARVGRANGVLYLSMTPPDEAGINVGWIYDNIYEPGVKSSPKHDPDFLSVEMYATENRFVDQAQVQKRAELLPLDKREVYLYGRFLHLSNTIHPNFTDTEHFWCYDCRKRYPLPHGQECIYCGGTKVGRFCHVEDFTFDPSWPVVQIIDPHPRKPHMMQWVAVNPHDEFLHIHEEKVDGEVHEVARACAEIEERYRMQVAMRIMDPNMGKQASTSGRRDVSWDEDFADAGLRCVMGDDNFEVGRSRINQYLMPDERTASPRMSWHPRCTNAIYQYKRYVFGEHARYSEKEEKQTPNPKDDDFPTMDRYLVNANVDFDSLKYLDRPMVRSGRGRNKSTGY